MGRHGKYRGYMNGAPVTRPDEAITSHVAQQQDRALAAVQALLAKSGIRGLLLNTITLTLKPEVSNIHLVRRTLPPELSIPPAEHSKDRRRITVSVGRKSTSYLVSVPSVPLPKAIEGDDPQGVVDLIMGTR